MFTIRLLKTVTIGTRRAAAGATFDADARTAHELIRSQSAVLADDGDLARLVRALGADAGRRPAPITR